MSDGIGTRLVGRMSRELYSLVGPNVADRERLLARGFRPTIATDNKNEWVPGTNWYHPLFGGSYRRHPLFEIALLDIFGDDYIDAATTIAEGRGASAAIEWRGRMIQRNEQAIYARYRALIEARASEGT